jgi:hypothetical protein
MERRLGETRGTGLLMVWSDIDPGYGAEGQRLYNEEQFARLLALPGFLSVGRYDAGSPGVYRCVFPK